jgi:hypothetical protein
MTALEQNAIAEIQGTKGFQVLNYLVTQRLNEINSVDGLDARSVDKVGVEALARAKSVKFLKELLQDMGFVLPVNKDNKKTYE